MYNADRNEETMCVSERKKKIKTRMMELSSKIKDRTERGSKGRGNVKVASEIEGMTAHSVAIFLYRCRSKPIPSDTNITRLLRIARIVGVKFSFKDFDIGEDIESVHKMVVKALKIFLIENDMNMADVARKLKKSREYISRHMSGRGLYVAKGEKETFVNHAKDIMKS